MTSTIRHLAYQSLIAAAALVGAMLLSALPIQIQASSDALRSSDAAGRKEPPSARTIPPLPPQPAEVPLRKGEGHQRGERSPVQGERPIPKPHLRKPLEISPKAVSIQAKREVLEEKEKEKMLKEKRERMERFERQRMLQEEARAREGEFEERKEQLRQQLEERRAKAREQLKERRRALVLRIDAQLQKTFKRIKERLSAAVVRLEKVADKLERRLNLLDDRFGARGFDSAAPRAALEEARAAIEEARGQVESLSFTMDLSSLASQEASDDTRIGEAIRDAVQEMRSEVRGAIQAIHNARRTLIEAVRATRVALGEVRRSARPKQDRTPDEDATAASGEQNER